MCGVCGTIYRNSAQNVSSEQMKRMNNTLIHRGPDDEGYFIEGNVGLGQRRLSIIDVASGHQPIFNEDKSVTIVFNGEIYNYEELRRELARSGHSFSTKSDTEVIVHAYEEYGPDCVKKLRGMFAFAIWDKKAKRLMLARDRVGKKPLYYYQDNQMFLFASEIKAILKPYNIQHETNISMLDFYLSLGYVPGRETLFKNIYKLEPGQYLLLNKEHNVRRTEYWDIDAIQEEKICYSEACSRLWDILRESVRIRLMSEVPLGVFLSGGLDSSVIVALMSQAQSQSIKTFSVGYEDEPNISELKYARIIADRFKTEHHEFYLTPNDLFDSIETLLEYAEEPLVESAGIALYKLAKLAKPMATVLLSGEGADEILAGYQIYPKMQSMDRIYRIYSMLPKKIADKLLTMYNGSEKADKYIDWVREPFVKRYRSLSFDLSSSIKETMYAPDLRKNATAAFENYFMSLHNKVLNKTMLRRMLYIDTKSWLAEDILLKADRMTMAASVELRAPFLDQKLIEFSSSLPDDYKLKNGRGKYILRDIMKDMLPDEILYRRKRGFPVPLTSWFSGELKEKARNLLTNEKAMGRGYFKPKYVHGLFDRIEKGEDLGKRIFSLITLELWHRKYID